MRQLRPACTEIVIGVDSRLDPGRLGHYAEVADRLLRYEFVDSVEQAIPWILSQCTGEWVMQVDGDEVFSPALIEQLPELTRSKEAFQYWTPCFWLYPDAAHYLAQPPWQFTAPRLWRNDPATAWHTALSHGDTEPTYPSKYLREGFYHLALLLEDLAARRQKVSHYLSIASIHPRPEIEVSVPAFYLPEDDRRFGIEPVPVPDHDRAAIAEVVSASGDEKPGPPARDIPLFTWSEIQRVWPYRRLPDEAYRGELKLFERPLRFDRGQRRPVTMRVTNLGSEHWPGMNRAPSIKLSHRWLIASEGTGQEPWIDTLLPASLPPAADALVRVPVTAPEVSGDHSLEFTLVHDDLVETREIRRFSAVSLPVHVE
jgi:hypothetical protein